MVYGAIYIASLVAIMIWAEWNREYDVFGNKK